MRKLVSAIIVILAFCAVTFCQLKYDSYNNDRFGFSIDYPESLLKMQPAPENDDGRTFLSTDGKLEMRVWGQYNALSETIDERYNATLKSFPEKPAYMVLKPARYVVSGVRDGKIVYVKTLYKKGKGTDVFYTLTIEYPAADKAKWDAVVTHVANSFTITEGAGS